MKWFQHNRSYGAGGGHHFSIMVLVIGKYFYFQVKNRILRI